MQALILSMMISIVEEGKAKRLQAHSSRLFWEVSKLRSMPITTTIGQNPVTRLWPCQRLPCHPSLLQMPTALPSPLPELSTFLQYWPYAHILPTILNKSVLLIISVSPRAKHTPLCTKLCLVHLGRKKWGHKKTPLKTETEGTYFSKQFQASSSYFSLIQDNHLNDSIK